MEKICVFCGSSRGNNPQYIEQAELFGEFLAAEKIDLVYGGGKVGIMGIIADAVLSNNGRAIGVITKQLFNREVAHTQLTELHIVSSMHERKAKMESLSDGFIALPGGVGTLDEIIEIFTWSQLSIHRKPFGFLNINNYFSHLFDFFKKMKDDGFLHPGYLERLIFSDNHQHLLQRFKSYPHEDVNKWL